MRSTVRLGEIAEIEMGSSPPGDTYNNTGDGSPLLNGPTEFTDLNPIPRQWTTAPVKLCQPGDILICVRGASTGRMNVADREYCIGRGIAAIRDKTDRTATQFLRELIEHRISDLLKSATGSTFAAVDRRALAAIALPAFSAAERRLLGQTMRRFRSMIDQSAELLRAKEEFRRLLFEDLLHGRRQFRSIGAYETRAIRIGEWGEVKGGRQRSPHLTQGELRPYLRVANVLDGRIDTSDVLAMRFSDEEFARYALLPGDVLLNEGQSSDLVGRSALYDGLPAVYAFQNTLVRFRAGPDCNPHFAHELFRHLWRVRVFERIANKTTSIAHLGVERFAAIEIRVPPLLIQQRVAELLRALETEHLMRMRLLSLHQAQKRALMQRLLSGDIPDLDPAA